MQIESLLTRNDISPYKEAILQWTKSKEFAKYQTQSYHPLLNPKQVEYNKIPASVAWELNLPLPQKFKFVFWGSHGVGNTGFGVFLAKYGGIAFYSTNNLNGKENYSSLYNQIINAKILPHQFAYLALRNFPNDKDAQKFHHLIYAQKGVNLVRDPISMLKHYIGMRRYNNKSARHFSLHTNPNNIFPQLVGYTAINGG